MSRSIPDNKEYLLKNYSEDVVSKIIREMGTIQYYSKGYNAPCMHYDMRLDDTNFICGLLYSKNKQHIEKKECDFYDEHTDKKETIVYHYITLATNFRKKTEILDDSYLVEKGTFSPIIVFYPKGVTRMIDESLFDLIPAESCTKNMVKNPNGCGNNKL